jgi:transposase InsO family protein
MQTGWVIAALTMALQTRQPGKGLLHHSDPGSQYASNDYQQLLTKQRITCSMSRKGNCYDNAVMERFFATLKQELVYRRPYESRKQAEQAIFEYIHVWYNRQRMHAALEYLSPEQFENRRQNPIAA